jgi:NAD(P)-dependent dehydrogenase (short-subunit alcohol dehydrogenase family)
MVTGASTGIGRAVVASALQGGASRVFASVRAQKDSDSLSAEFGERIVPLVFDVADEAGVRAGAARAAEMLNGALLFGLVNNAGIAVPGPLLHMDASELERQLDINVMGVHRVTQAFAPLLGAAPGATGNRGRIVMMSSVGGRRASPFNGPYNASKFALEGYSSALRKELMLYGVDVIVIGPGAIATPIWAKSEAGAFDKYANTPFAPYMEKVRDYMMKLGREGLDASAVGDLVWRALTISKPKARYSIMRDPIRSDYLQRLLPARMVDGMTARFLGYPKRR